MSIDRLRVQPGMEVYAADAKNLGRIKQVDSDGFQVEHKNKVHFVPRSAVAEVSETEHRVDLRISSDDVQQVVG